jgi:hypothetical protein
MCTCPLSHVRASKVVDGNGVDGDGCTKCKVDGLLCVVHG